MTTPAPTLALLPFQRDLIAYLRSEEPELWRWYSSTTFLDEYATNVRLGLLKSCYRLERDAHPDVYGLVDEVRASLGITAAVTVYQSQTAVALNAWLAYLPGEAHVVLEGPVTATLTRDELRAALAHELTHYLIWQFENGDLLVADQMISAMASHPRAEASHVETARLFRLYLEIHADRGSVVAGADPMVAIGSLVKVQTGLADAQGESYLRQAEEIFAAATEVKTEELTHPESFIRARALKLWSDSGDAANEAIASMIESRLDLARLGLPGQKRLSAMTRGVLARLLRPGWLRTDARLAHARLFFSDLDPEREAETAVLPSVEELAAAHETVRRYLSYVLLDMATVDRESEDAPLAASLRMAEELGLGALFPEIAATELELSKRALTRLRKDAAQMVAAAEKAGTEGPA
jgi:hypothetical protein